MITLSLLSTLLACASTPAPSAPPSTDSSEDEEEEAPFAPVEGEWAVTVSETWEGDCELEDDRTRQDPEQRWILDPRGETVVVYLDFWSLYPCALEDQALLCDAGSWSYATFGGGIEVSRVLSLEFEDETRFEGAFLLDVACEGTSACEALMDYYGEALSPPCSFRAPVLGELDVPDE